jgi:hypothetical protein
MIFEVQGRNILVRVKFVEETPVEYDIDSMAARHSSGRRDMMIALAEERGWHFGAWLARLTSRPRLFIGKIIECNRVHKLRYGLIGRQCRHWNP